MSFDERLAGAQAAIQSTLDDLLAHYEAPVGDAMRYACAGGKRLRGYLVLETARIAGASRDHALRAAAAIECVHAYSLIHDDLPCMDDDDLRRGRPTVHRKWDEATAVLAGDGLLTAGFEILADEATHPDPLVRSELILSLSRDAGASGMIAGQARDIAAETASIPLDRKSVV